SAAIRRRSACWWLEMTRRWRRLLWPRSRVPCQSRRGRSDMGADIERSHDRRRALLRAHYAAENANDLDRIMGTFSPGAGTAMVYNRQEFADPDGIRAAHAYIGFSAAGAFAGVQTIADHEHLTA